MNKSLDDFIEATAEEIATTHTYPRGVQRVLDVLADGRWHINRDIIEKSNQMHITARIYEARQQGLNIEYKRNGMDHVYRWVK